MFPYFRYLFGLLQLKQQFGNNARVIICTHRSLRVVRQVRNLDPELHIILFGAFQRDQIKDGFSVDTNSPLCSEFKIPLWFCTVPCVRLSQEYFVKSEHLLLIYMV